MAQHENPRDADPRFSKDPRTLSRSSNAAKNADEEWEELDVITSQSGLAGVIGKFKRNRWIKKKPGNGRGDCGRRLAVGDRVFAGLEPWVVQ